MFGRRVLTIAFAQGASVLAAVFAVYLWTILTARPDTVVRSLTFASLVIGNLALILVNRSWRLSIVGSFRERRNVMLYWILGVAGTLLVLLLSVPVVRSAFRFGPIGPIDWLVAVAAGFLGVAWFEVYKAVSARRGRRVTG